MNKPSINISAVVLLIVNAISCGKESSHLAALDESDRYSANSSCSNETLVIYVHGLGDSYYRWYPTMARLGLRENSHLTPDATALDVEQSFSVVGVDLDAWINSTPEGMTHQCLGHIVWDYYLGWDDALKHSGGTIFIQRGTRDDRQQRQAHLLL